MNSLRVKLLLALVGLPVVALVSVGIAMQYANETRLDRGAQFTVVHAQRAGTGLVTGEDLEEFQVKQIRNAPNEDGQSIRFEAADGEIYTLRATDEFLRAFQADQEALVNSLNHRLLIAVGVVTVLAVIIALLFWRRMIKPVNRLTDAVRRLESGDFSQRVDPGTSDEIGELGRAFNAMAESMHSNDLLRKRMTSDVAHELRTPLNNLAGYLDAIADGVVEADESVVASLQEETELMIRLVRDLEQLALADTGRMQLFPEETNVREVIDSSIQAARARANAKGVALRAEGEPGVSASIDTARIAQVLRNLVENAIVNTPAGGTVTAALAAEDNHAVIRVTDTGQGIPEEHIQNIFERFYRVDPSRHRATGGAGLGLAIVRQIVEAHGGTVAAANAPHGGAEFTVRLPCEATARTVASRPFGLAAGVPAR